MRATVVAGRGGFSGAVGGFPSGVDGFVTFPPAGPDGVPPDGFEGPLSPPPGLGVTTFPPVSTPFPFRELGLKISTPTITATSPAAAQGSHAGHRGVAGAPNTLVDRFPVAVASGVVGLVGLAVRRGPAVDAATVGLGASLTWAGTLEDPSTGSGGGTTGVSGVVLAAVLLRTGGTGLVGVLMAAAMVALGLVDTSEISCCRVGSSGLNWGALMASSILGHRCAGSLAIMRITLASSSGGISGRSSRSGLASSLKWAYIIAIAVLAVNGFRPTSISYATTPSEY